MRLIVLLLVCGLTLVPSVVNAQTTPAPQGEQTMAGQWEVSLKVTKGNNQDKARIGSGGTFTCVQGGQDVICHGAGTSRLEGTFDGGKVTADGDWAVTTGEGATTQCSWNQFLQREICSSGTSTRGYRIQMHFTGTMDNTGVLRGDWTAVLIVGLGHYNVEGTWEAIKAGP